MDFYKDNDKVDFSTIVHKVRELEIGANIGSWIGSFLSYRIRRVKDGNSLLEVVKIVSIGPPGSILGPFFFLVDIQDIGVKCMAKPFFMWKTLR